MLVGQYNFLLVGCSLVVAILASYTALSMAERVYESAEGTKWWHIGGSVAMGVGIWSMHFIGMLAYSLPIKVGYDLGLTLLSLVIAIVISYFALSKVLSSQYANKRHVLSCAILMGLGISAMHYTGMEAMQMFPAIRYEPKLFVLSILIAILASYAALRIIIWVRLCTKLIISSQILAAIVMGLAIVGMHYTGMMAAQFAENSICGAASFGITPNILAVLVALGCFVILAVSNLASIFDVKAVYLVKSLEVANQQLKTQSLYDPLTKLPNRVMLEELVKQALQKADYNQYCIEFMVIDLDAFKTINDSMGRRVGDAFLVEAANRIRLSVDEQHMVARTTGNEFVVVLEQLDAEGATKVAENILAIIKQPLMIDGKELVTTASIGIAVSFISGDTYEHIAFRADAAMNYTKQTGKNSYHYYEEAMGVDATHKLELISHLRHAIELDQLSLYYQPKFDVKTKRINSAEALLRWRHPEHGEIPPVTFIPLAEESGLIDAIGDWVLNEACRQVREWRSLGHQEINVAVNFSSVQFSQENLYLKIVNALAYWAIPATSLTIEITESTAMRDVEHSLDILQEIADLGVKVSIDDFGTGYSSLMYLKRFPASELKIDRGFIKTLGTSGEDELLVSAMISLGHQFGLKVVAEGVETQSQKHLLMGMKCDTLQGYFLGKPQPADAFFNNYLLSKDNVNWDCNMHGHETVLQFD